MIPLTLHIKNFLSYGNTQTINFAPYHLICLSGKNGHGKSALLDALTWAIWGQARKTANSPKPDEGLLRLGQTSMMVMLDVQVHSHIFRIRREFTLSGHKATTHLDFGLLDHTGNVKPLTDKTIRTTQEKINQALGLDYEGFINSVFLRQGQSNEFSKKSPKERKDILSRILGLETFECMRKQALEKIRLLSIDKDYLRTLIEQTEPQLAQKVHVHYALQEALAEQTRLEQQVEQLNQEVLLLSNQKNSLYQNYNKLELQLVHKNSLEQTIATKKARILEIAHEFRNTLTQLHMQPLHEKEEYQALFNKLQQQREEQITIHQKLLTIQERLQQRNQFLQEQYLSLLTQKTQKFHHLHNEVEQLTLHLRTLIDKHTHLLHEYQKDIQKKNGLAQQLEKNSVLLTDYEKEEKLFEKRKLFFHNCVNRGNRIHAELKALLHKKSLMCTTAHSVCPLCNQLLDEQHKNELLIQLENEERWYIRHIQKITQLITTTKSLLQKHHAELENLKQLYQQTVTIRAAYDTLHENTTKYQQELRKLEEIGDKTRCALEIKKSEMIQAQEEYNLCHKTGEHYTYKNEDTIYQALKEEENVLKSWLENNAFDEEAYRRIALKLQTFQDTKTEEWNTLQKQRKETVIHLIQETKKLKQEYAQLVVSTASLPTLKELLKQTEYEEKALQQTMQDLQQQRVVLSSKKGALEQSLQNIIQKEEEYAQVKNKLNFIQTALQEYQLIAHALSKDGIQALLIENALPEVEQEANSLLSRLTDNQAQLTIDSMRDLKSGGTKETLDIKISDTIGIRPYELFSGGEAFRIDFALRIALSKLVARRAGTALQILIIDEGFGSQDEEGLAHIMDALYKIQEDFAKIIIVSHLPSLKDQFPVHFVIHKGSQGSTISIHEQG